jgi:hypothetical protein
MTELGVRAGALPYDKVEVGRRAPLIFLIYGKLLIYGKVEGWVVTSRAYWLVRGAGGLRSRETWVG